MTEPAPARPGWSEAWLRFWFEPATPQSLALVRILVGSLGLALLWSYAGDLERWFGAGGVVSPEIAAAWRGPWAFTLYDLVGSTVGLRLLAAGTGLAFLLLALGLGGSTVAVIAALLWASLLHRGPMLAGPADDCLAVLIWCLAVGRATDAWSVDRRLAARRGRPLPPASWRTRVALALLRVHATAIALAAALAQLKGDVWWDGTAAWWLATRAESRLVDLAPAFRAAAYLQDLVTHAIPLFEIVWAVGLWLPLVRIGVARCGLIAWPVIGIVAGEPLWGIAMAIFSVPDAWADAAGAEAPSPGAR